MGARARVPSCECDRSPRAAFDEAPHMHGRARRDGAIVAPSAQLRQRVASMVRLLLARRARVTAETVAAVGGCRTKGLAWAGAPQLARETAENGTPSLNRGVLGDRLPR
jgi:hypothetical protein